MMFWALLTGVALSARPDSGAGLYAFESSDVLDYVDGPMGMVRVHFSIDGPNVTRLADADKDGIADYPLEVATVAEDVLDFYGALGFRPPITESEMGLGDLGGSAAFDVYLVDFGGGADGQFSIDACAGTLCSGFMVIENDFYGYGYSSLSEAVQVLASHELFHAVQAAYNAAQPPWISEGMAVWAEQQYEPGVEDFIWFANQYLKDTGRSIDSPPAGTVTAFSYGTALFFQFLTERFGEGFGPDLLSALEGVPEEETMDAVVLTIEDYDGSLFEEWSTFSLWNVVTGSRAGVTDSYSFASELRLMDAEQEGTFIEDDNRFYPLAATYYHLEHPGGPLSFVTVDDPTGLVFSLLPVNSEGQLEPPLHTWTPDDVGETVLGDVDPGEYWFFGTYPQQAEQSSKIAFCLGEQSIALTCLPQDVDTGQPSTTPPAEDGGCGKQAMLLPAMAMSLLLTGRRRGRGYRMR